MQLLGQGGCTEYAQWLIWSAVTQRSVRRRQVDRARGARAEAISRVVASVHDHRVAADRSDRRIGRREDQDFETVVAALVHQEIGNLPRKAREIEFPRILFFFFFLRMPER